MRSVISKIWIPAVLVGMAAVQSFGIDAGRAAGSSGYSHFRDSISGTKADSLIIDSAAMDSITHGSAASDSGTTDSTATDSTALELTPQLTARDTIFAPDSLRETDPLRYRYYVELILCRAQGFAHEAQHP